jgi:glycine/D-amino acid oxidase-like deaminating enzyme
VLTKVLKAGGGEMHVVICGGGVIGAAAAFELSRRKVAVTVVERWRVAGAASGKSGGFLARDWCDGTPVASLAQRSFDLHEVWAEQLGNPYGYRKVDTFSAALSLRRSLGPAKNTHLAAWLAPDAAHRSQLGTTATTAQLDPEAFTRALMDAATARGGKLEIATVAQLHKTHDGKRVAGVVLEDGRTILADAVILAMGPWSLLAARWVLLPPIYGLKGHSIVFKPNAPLPAEAVFAEFEDSDGEVLTPEIVPRADGTLYVCGLSGSAALPIDPAKVRPEDGGCEKLREISVRLVPQLLGAQVIAEQACYRPIARDGLPVIGAVPQLAGAYIATGHSVWGMLNAPGTAEALTELITAGASSIDLAPFSPSRMPAADFAMPR